MPDLVGHPGARSVRLSFALGLLLIAGPGVPAKAAAPLTADEDICHALPQHLIPLKVSKARYGKGGEAVAFGGRYSRGYTGHSFVYTRFGLRDGMSDYVLATGQIEEHSASGNATYFFSASHFCWAGWIEDKTSDLVGSVLPSVVRVQDALQALEDGSASGKAKTKQDLNTIRVGVLGNNLYLITTWPDVIVAQLRFPERDAASPAGYSDSDEVKPPRYFSCPLRISKAIEADTAKAWSALKLAPTTKGSRTCGG